MLRIGNMLAISLYLFGFAKTVVDNIGTTFFNDEKDHYILTSGYINDCFSLYQTLKDVYSPDHEKVILGPAG